MKAFLYIIISLFNIALTIITGYVFIFAFCSTIGCTIYRELFMTIFIAALSLIIISWIIFLFSKKSRMLILSTTPILLILFCISFLFIYRTDFETLKYYNGYYTCGSYSSGNNDVYSRYGYKFKDDTYAYTILNNGSIAALTISRTSYEEQENRYGEEISKVNYHVTIYIHNKIGKLIDSQFTNLTLYYNRTNESDSYFELPSGKYVNGYSLSAYSYEILFDSLKLHNNL